MNHSKKSIVALGVAGVLALGPRPLWALSWRGADAPSPASAPSAQAREAAAARLEGAGLSPAEARARAASMAPEEVAHVADGETQVRRGGDGFVTVLVIVAIVAIVYFMYDHAQHQY